MTKLVSVITIVFNGEKTIERCLNSVSQFSDDRIEHLVIDGQSHDRTMDIVKGVTLNNNLNYFSEPDEGIADAFNKGVKLAKGKFLIFLNADDHFNSINIKELMSKLEILNDDHILCCGMNIFSEDSQKLTLALPPDPSVLKYRMSIYHPSAFIGRGVFDQVGCFSLNFKIAMDYDFFLRAFLKNIPFTNFETCITTFYTGGVSSALRSNILLGYFEILKSQYRQGCLTLKSVKNFSAKSFSLFLPKGYKSYLSMKNMIKRLIPFK